jgi:predicted molibdopterin-dependent oxidoreductase YjgC
MERIFTICPFCGCGCGMYLMVEAGRLIGVEPSPGHPVSRGMLCAKGWSAYEFVHSPDRLTQPLIRRGGQLQESSWDEALDFICERLIGISPRYGPDSLGFLCSAKATNEENYLFMKFARAAFKTNNVDHCARL